MTPLIESEEKELTNKEEKAKAEAVAKSAAAAAASTAEKVAEKAAKAAQEEIKKAEVKKEEKGGGEDKCKVEIARKADILAGWLGMHKGYALAVLFCHYVKLGLSHDAETAWELLEEEERER